MISSIPKFTFSVDFSLVLLLKREDMDDAKSIFDELDEAEEARAIHEAEAEIDAGKGIPHSKVRQWLRKLAKGKFVPPPCE